LPVTSRNELDEGAGAGGDGLDMLPPVGDGLDMLPPVGDGADMLPPVGDGLVVGDGVKLEGVGVVVGAGVGAGVGTGLGIGAGVLAFLDMLQTVSG
jgi:hypothetical protein